ncbi:MAG: hypothetical protein L0Y79_07870 [Chlorobi bacterium]|nr:hypothetical protein [Chlorobiota bacterium]MCI0715623.1 hypothetical protein [Chlorobiota bacterium]
MNRYLVETSHSREDCLHVLDQFVVHGHITHFEWGCESGVCTGWAIIEAESEESAQPPLFQEGVIEALVKEAGLALESAEEMDCIWRITDKESVLRGVLSAGLTTLV